MCMYELKEVVKHVVKLSGKAKKFMYLGFPWTLESGIIYTIVYYSLGLKDRKGRLFTQQLLVSLFEFT